MNRVAGRAWSLWLMIGLLLGGLGFFCREYALHAPTWVLHSGNPHVYQGTGTLALGKVLDRDGNFLLQLSSGRVYAADASVRMSTLHWLGDRSGNIRGSALETYADRLVGFSWVDGLYGYGGGGGDAMLTLSSAAQAAALEAMGSFKGTVAVCNYKTGELLCAVTTPTYDPDGSADLSGDDYEGVYLNRFTQVAYVPGSIFKIVTTAAVMESLPDAEQMTYTCTGSYAFGSDKVTCERAHGKQDLQAAMKNSCNCFYAHMTMALGRRQLQDYVRRCGVLDSIDFDGIRTVSGNFLIEGAADVQVAWSAIGQHKDLVNPCAFLTFVCAVANGGVGPTPYIVRAISVGEKSAYQAHPQYRERIMSPETATILRSFMRNNVVNNYGEDKFPKGMTVCAKSGTGEVDGEKKPYAMFVGFVTEEAYPLAFIAAVEDAGYGKTVCIPIIARLLTVCKTVLDAQS